MLILTTLLNAALAAPLGADELAIAYHGDFITHPGVDGRLSWTLNDHPSRPFSLETEIGGYWHPRNLVAAYVQAGPSVRWETKRGSTYGLFAHVGAQHGFYAAPTYTTEGGAVQRARLAGDSWWTLRAGPEFGHTLKGESLNAWFIRTQIGLRLPTVHTVGLDFAVSAGVRI
ncbi:MAG: hypothetical protein AAFV53_00870 [Myxococcota bacterium]